jgi:ribosome-associated translation inhibitor RaiA
MGHPPNRYWTARARAPYTALAAREELRHRARAARMTIDITGAGFVLTRALRGRVRRRVLLSLSRFGPEVHDVAARLAVAHNPLGGVDQRCRVRARLHSGLVLRAEAMNGLIETAVGRSVAHLALLVAEAVDGAGGRHPPPAGWRRRGFIG